MNPNAQRSEGGHPGANAYWRRRFFTLLAGLGVIGLLAWACSGLASGGNSAHGSGSGKPSSAAYTTPTASPTSPAPAGTSPSASPSASPSVSSTPKSSASAKPAKVAATGRTACPAADLVLTLTPSQASYGAKDTPAFRVDIVSTDAAPCSLDTGSAALKLVVLHGGAQAYNSASCLHGAKPDVISLRRGVPVVTSMSWNKQQTVTGCTATVMAATNRTYNAVAEAGGAESPGTSFRLTGTAAPVTPAAAKPTAPAASTTMNAP